MSTLTFHMQNQLDAVDPMVLTLKGQVRSVLSDDALCRFDICLSETLANLVLHATTAIQGACVDVVLHIAQGTVVAEVFDPVGADAFDIRDRAHDLDDVDALAESGRGLGLIVECADAVDYGKVNDRYRLSLTFVDENLTMNGVAE